MNEDLKYLVIIVLILAGLTTFHNIGLSKDDALSLGYCDTEHYCAGFNAGGVCMGVEQLRTSCVSPENASVQRTVEAECAVQAYNLCERENLTGTKWLEKATYQNRTCGEWSEQNQDIEILECSQMSPSVQKWKDIR